MKVNLNQVMMTIVIKIIFAGVGLALRLDGFGKKRIRRILDRVEEYCDDNLTQYRRDGVVAERVKRDYNSLGVGTWE